MKEKSFERKSELLKAALDEFTAKSYEEASLNTILKNAGISKGTFYYHFTDKQSLYLFLLESSVKAKWDFIREQTQMNPVSLSGCSIFEQFKQQARLGAEFAAQYPEYHKLGCMLSKEQGTPIYKMAKDQLGGETDEILTAMIDAAIADGDFRDGFSRTFLVRIVTHLLTSFDEIFNTDRDFELQTMLMNLDAYVDFIRYGIGR